MSTRTTTLALGAAALLLAAPATYALAGDERPGRPASPGGVHACEDGVDNDGDGLVDFAGGDPDCESPRDNSEEPEEPDTVPNPRGVLGQIRDLLPAGEEEPPAEEPPAEEPPVEEPPAEEPPVEEPPVEEPPAEEPPAEDPLAPVLQLLDEVLGQLPAPPSA